MNDLLDLEKQAKPLAKMLKSIPGFPWDEDTIAAIATDLVRWCHGAFVDNEMYPAIDQATWVINEMRETWDRWKGTAAMRQLFQGKFERKKLHPEQEVFDKRKWEAEYGPPDPEWSAKLLRLGAPTGNRHKDFVNTLLSMRYQSIRDSLYFTEGEGRFQFAGKSDKHKRADQQFWQQAMDGHNKARPELVGFFRRAIANGQLEALPPVPEYNPESAKAHSLTQQEYENLSPPVPEVPKPRCVECGGSGRLAFDEYCTCAMGRDLYRIESGRKL